MGEVVSKIFAADRKKKEIREKMKCLDSLSQHARFENVKAREVTAGTRGKFLSSGGLSYDSPG